MINPVTPPLSPAQVLARVNTRLGQSGTYLGFEFNQASAPATPAAGFRMYADSLGRHCWVGSNGYVRCLDMTGITASRTYTFPNASVTLAGLSITQTWTAAQSFTGTGTFLGLETNQASAPATPAAGFRMYADNLGRHCWVGSNGFVRCLDMTGITASRTYTFPDASTTLAGLSVAQTFTAVQTISNATATTSITTGALVVTGGIGMGSASIGSLANNSVPATNASTKTLTDSGMTVDTSESVSLVNLAHGAGPTTPINGDLWTATTGQRNRINGVTQTVAYIDLAATYSVPLLTTSTGGIGYASGAGAGGTVTQLTSKSTGVTLSKVAGTITMNNAALAAGTAVSFTFTNTLLTADDFLNIKHVSGGTMAAYTVTATEAAGSATVTVRNNTAGSLSEAIVLKFKLDKSTTT